MPLDIDRVNQLLAQLERYIQDLGRLKDKPESEFNLESDTEAIAERRTYKAIQAALDIGQHIISSQALGVPRFYRDVFSVLGQRGVISAELQAKLEKMAGTRNILAHEYAQIKPEIIYEIVQKDYQDLIKFAEAVSDFIREKNEKSADNVK